MQKSKQIGYLSSNRLDDDDDDEKNIIIAIDSTGIKVTNRGPQWMQQEKWQVKKEEERLSKDPYCSRDINTKEIYSLQKLQMKKYIYMMEEKLCQN